MSDGLDFDDFLSHKASASGGGGFVGNWKDDGSILLWLHPASRVHPIWSHRWLRLDTGDAENPLSSFKSMRVNCIEPEAVLKRQRFRNKDGTRELPPTLCPHCILIEKVRALIATKELSWTDPLFKFAVEGGDEPIVVHAGGFTGMFQKRDMKDEEEKQLRRAGIRRDEAFKENGSAGLEYLLTVVLDGKPEEGPRILMEKTALGDAVKVAIAARMEEYEEAELEHTNWRGETFKGKAAGNPKNNPCALKLTYDEHKDFSDKYAAKVFDKKVPSEAVLAQFDVEPPNVSRMIAAPNLVAHKKALERYCLLDIDFDALFAPAFKHLGIDPTAADGGAEDDLPEDWGGSAERTPEVGGKAAAPAEEDGMVACDACNKPFPDTAMECPHCGAEYEDVDGNIQLKPKPEPVVAKGKRSAKKAT